MEQINKSELTVRYLTSDALIEAFLKLDPSVEWPEWIRGIADRRAWLADRQAWLRNRLDAIDRHLRERGTR
jgi:hypothetical protein